MNTVEIQTKRYRAEEANSRRLYEQACQLMPGGNSRHSLALMPYPIYVRGGSGCRVVDVEGEERLDFVNNYTSLILGHVDPEVTLAVCRRVQLGTAFAMPTAEEVELARALVERMAEVEQIRFCNSGSEAVLLAVKAARAYTGRPKIAKFEGAYHGIYDYVQVSEGPSSADWGPATAPTSVVDPGSSPSIASDVVTLSWNHLESCRQLIAANAGELAAVVLDPHPAGIGFIPPQPGFLDMLREETARRGILLIADQVMSFRLSWGGALAGTGIIPDMTALGKIIGGGFPVGAVGGSRSAMSVFDHTGQWKVHHGGTFNANPVTMTAGLATLRQMTPQAFERLNRLGDYVRERLRRMLKDAHVDGVVHGRGSLFIAHLGARDFIDYRSMQSYSRSNPQLTSLCHEMLSRGVVVSPRGLFGCLSMPMTESALDEFVNATYGSLCALRMAS